VMQGTLSELVKGDRRPALVRSPRAGELRDVLEAAGASVTRDGRQDAMLVHNASLEQIGTLAAENGIAVFELTHEAATLEDRFLELTGDGGNVR
ncbi:MAG: ABC transporter ATP-binding protein, partial [Solirubrobacteraceae bacterium]